MAGGLNSIFCLLFLINCVLCQVYYPNQYGNQYANQYQYGNQYQNQQYGQNVQQHYHQHEYANNQQYNRPTYHQPSPQQYHRPTYHQPQPVQHVHNHYGPQPQTYGPPHPQPYGPPPPPYGGGYAPRHGGNYGGFSEQQVKTVAVAGLGLLAAGAIGYTIGANKNRGNTVVVDTDTDGTRRRRSPEENAQLERALRLFSMAMENDQYKCVPQAVCLAAYRGQKPGATGMEKAVGGLGVKVINKYGRSYKFKSGGEQVFYASVLGLKAGSEKECLATFSSCEDSKPTTDAIERMYSMALKRKLPPRLIEDFASSS